MPSVGIAVCRRRELWAREGFLPSILITSIPTGAHLRLRATQRASRQADLAFGLPAHLNDRTLACLCGGALSLLEQLPHPLPGYLASERVDGRPELQSQIIRRVLVAGLQRLQALRDQPGQHA